MVPAAMLTAEGRVSPLWLVGLFFLQTVGELLLEPRRAQHHDQARAGARGEPRARRLVPAAALGNKLAGVLGSGFTSTRSAVAGVVLPVAGRASSLVAALVLFALTPWVKRLMSGDW